MNDLSISDFHGPNLPEKRDLKPILRALYICVDEKDYYGCLAIFQRELLSNSPNLSTVEYAARELFSRLPEKTHLAMCKKILERNEDGSGVAVGTALQMRLENKLEDTIVKTVELIKESGSARTCDQLSRRVLGEALCRYTAIVTPILPNLALAEGKWTTRAVGMSIEYAAAKGLSREFAEELFYVLLEITNISEEEAREGIAAGVSKMTECFPEIVTEILSQQRNSIEVSDWFQNEINKTLAQKEASQQ